VTRRLLASATFQRQLAALGKTDQRRILRALAALAENPFDPRPGADIRALEGTDPPKHRLRVGAYRVVYAVGPRDVRILEVFRRGRDYR
jgi:mRNA interferase RelE/StbE